MKRRPDFTPEVIQAARLPKTPTIDDEANAFAMELLMPSAWLLSDLEKMGGVDIGDDDALHKLAKRYGVSDQMMAIRVGQLTRL